MNRLLSVCMLLVLLVGCTGEGGAMSWTWIENCEVVEPTCGEEHGQTQQPNTLPHEVAGYCGNTWTTVTYPYRGEPEWSASFMFGPSVELTDLLRWLDYSRPICRCPSEYRVDTEFGTDYGINLSQGFVRHGDGQAELTEEQVTRLAELLDREYLQGLGHRE